MLFFFLFVFIFITFLMYAESHRAMYVKALGITVLFYLFLCWVGLLYLVIQTIIHLYRRFIKRLLL